MADYDYLGDDDFGDDELGDEMGDELGDDEMGDDMDDEYGDDEDILAGDDDDVIGAVAEEYGASGRVSRNRIRRLLKRKAKLLALYPVVGTRRKATIKKRVARINKVLAKLGYTKSVRRSNDEIAASGITGLGGLEFTAQAPPGLGRLVRLPFYPSIATVPATVITAAGAGTVSATNPVVFLGQIATFCGGTSFQMATPSISWALLRLVGFESSQKRCANLIGTATAAAAATDDGEVGPAAIVKDLMIGGGATLFTHEEWADAQIYDANQPEFCGLRDYPTVKSPNFATVDVNQVGVIDRTNYRVGFSCAILCEVLVDDQYGAHVPGAYARKGAMVRASGSFV